MSGGGRRPRPATGFTGGQVALVRIVLGLGVLTALGLSGGGDAVLSSDTTSSDALPSVDVPIALWRGLGVIGGLLLLLGVIDRVVAPLLVAPALALLPLAPAVAVSAALLLHSAHPSAALLSLSRRGAGDPRGAWVDRRWVPAVAFLAYLVADALAVRSATDHAVARAGLNALLLVTIGVRRVSEGRVAPLVAWLFAFLLGGIATLSAGHGAALPALFALHLLGASPLWWPPRAPGDEPLLLYDGGCGLCHGAVRLVLSEDRGGLLRVAPLQGSTCAERLDAATRAALPDSLVLHTTDGMLLVRSDAVARLLAALGGFWRPLGAALSWLPRPLRDGGYDAVARVRKRVFAAPDGACPILPPDLVGRVLA